MHGNVDEWCEDHFFYGYEGAPTDGSAWTDGELIDRVLRGGSCLDFAHDCRSASRYNFDAEYRLSFVGFRPACSIGGVR
jgi:formylglycine-generating enzyme required for sulfatase activity